jgi:hypothetical protein
MKIVHICEIFYIILYKYIYVKSYRLKFTIIITILLLFILENLFMYIIFFNLIYFIKVILL